MIFRALKNISEEIGIYNTLIKHTQKLNIIKKDDWGILYMLVGSKPR